MCKRKENWKHLTAHLTHLADFQQSSTQKTIENIQFFVFPFSELRSVPSAYKDHTQRRRHRYRARCMQQFFVNQ